VAEELSADEALAAVGVVPSQPIPLLIGSVGVFPPNGALFLARNSISPTHAWYQQAVDWGEQWLRDNGL
jgi:hypothetical protein